MATTTKNPAALLINTLGVGGMEENIQAILQDAKDTAPALVEAGKSWYEDGNALAIEATGLNSRKACAIVAALSPQTSWSENIRNAQTLVQTRTAPTFGGSVNKALAILDGNDPAVVLGGKKVRYFFMNLNTPADDMFVTVDRHAVNIALGGIVEGSAKALELSGVYDMVSAAYYGVAMTHNLVPCQVQAITWLAHRTIHAPYHSSLDPQIAA